MVTDGTLKLVYASVILVDPEVQIGELNSLSQLLLAIRKVSGSLCQQYCGSAHTKVYSIHVSQ